MAKVISFVNFKGGVGKTTLAVEIAASLYKKFNARILMIDLDPQSNCTFYWMSPEDWKEHDKKQGTLWNFYNASLEGEDFDISSIIAEPTRYLRRPLYQSHDEELNRVIEIIPSHIELFGIDLRLATKFGSENLKAQLLLKQALKKIKDDYDFIFIDSPPNLNITVQNGLFASDFYVIVALAEYLSTLGIAHIQNLINQLFENANSLFDEEMYPEPELLGIIFNRLRYLTGGTSNEKKWINQLRDEYENIIFDTTLPQSQKIAERPEQCEPMALSDYAADFNYSQRIHELANEFYERIENFEE